MYEGQGPQVNCECSRNQYPDAVQLYYVGHMVLVALTNHFRFTSEKVNDLVYIMIS